MDRALPVHVYKCQKRGAGLLVYRTAIEQLAQQVSGQGARDGPRIYCGPRIDCIRGDGPRIDPRIHRERIDPVASCTQ
jgi:hypothetical protein